MPQVRMRTNAAGPEGSRIAGRIYNVSNDEAKALLEGNYAEPVRETPTEIATGEPSEETADSGKPASAERRSRRGQKSLDE